MKWELWFSESEDAVTLVGAGNANHAATLEPDTHRIAIIEADTVEDAKRQRDELLDGPDGFFTLRDRRA
ncbi:MAG TPA: hypothetical protein VLD18_09930 [Verrucomicrobiae bacterium]|nr:hypothetical protein [Verrucomicrobiae bacterium]